uniref:HVA22-like protein n=1 Tax=Triticum urartu TaxID=4572 RepID=A0A8R7PFH9_TRIUA
SGRAKLTTCLLLPAAASNLAGKLCHRPHQTHHLGGAAIIFLSENSSRNLVDRLHRSWPPLPENSTPVHDVCRAADEIPHGSVRVCHAGVGVLQGGRAADRADRSAPVLVPVLVLIHEPLSLEIILVILVIFDEIAGALISRIPMYYEVKLAFLVYLWYPQTRVGCQVMVVC